VKPAVSKALAVGTLVTVTGAAFLFAFTFFKKGGYSKSESYLVDARFSDATGLTWRSRVQIAGIQVGEVERIVLEGDRALLQLRVKNEVLLHADACLYKTFPSALLPDALLEVSPGSPDQPLLKDAPAGKREITCVREATSVQKLLDSMSKIASDVSLVTGNLADTVRENQGSLKDVVQNLAATTARLRELIESNDQNVTSIMRNTRDFTRDLRDISGREKERVHTIMVNVEQLTAELKTTAQSLDRILNGRRRTGPTTGGNEGKELAVIPVQGAAEPGGQGDAPGRGASGPTGQPGQPGQPGQAGAEPGQAGAPALPLDDDQAKGVDQAVQKLNDSLAKLDQILGKVQEGKSAAGRLLVDERMGRQVGSTVEGLSDYFDRLNRLQVQLNLRSEWLLNQSVTDGRPGAKVYFGARIIPRPDKYYELELVSDPRGVDTVTNYSTTTSIDGGPSHTTTSTQTKNTQTIAVSLQMAKRFGAVTLRGGIIENSGGLGVDVHMLDERLRLSLSMFQFNRPQNKVFPRAKLWADYVFLNHFYLSTGVDDFLNRYRSATRPGGRPFSIGTDVFFGAGLTFSDDDIKTLLGSGAAGAVGSVGR
jgi:phospholipid/cholesterol/gamma-HCH transport system substrate-binding protein